MTLWIALFATMQWQTGTAATLARAESLKDQGRMAEAIARYREFAESDPDHFEGQRRLGAALLEAGQLTEALRSAAARGRPSAGQCRSALQPRRTTCGRCMSSTRQRRNSSRRSPGSRLRQRRITVSVSRCGPAENATRRLRRSARAFAVAGERGGGTTTSEPCSNGTDSSMKLRAAYAKASTIDPSYADAHSGARDDSRATRRTDSGDRPIQARPARET